MGSTKILPYTQLVKGESYLMASGNIAHLIGTDILGDASYLFAFDNYKRNELIYPGLPGCVDHPIMNMKIINERVDMQIKEIRKTLLGREISAVLADFDCPEILQKHIIQKD